MTIRTDFDFATSLADALAFCREQGATILGSTEHGPGGGNPNVEVELANRDALDAFCLAYCDGDAERAREAAELCAG